MLARLFFTVIAASLITSAHAATRLAVLEVQSPELAKTAALLEAEVIKLPDVEALDRANLDQILKERKLGSTLGAADVAARLELGKILKADVLILIQAIPLPKPHANLIVFETRRGLRTHMTQFVPRKADTDAELLLPQIKAALERNRTPITEIVAVPRLVNRSLTKEYDYLGESLVRVMQAELLLQPGVAVVELEEARAIAREGELSGKGGERRALPLYLLGEYRFATNIHDPTASFELKLSRGEQLLKTDSLKDIPRAELTKKLRDSARTLLSNAIVKSGKTMPADPSAESRQLVERASVYELNSDHESALAMYEAALIVKPDQPDVHRLAHETVPYLCRKYSSDRSPSEAWEPEVNRRLIELELAKLRLKIDSLHHIEAFWRMQTVPAITKPLPVPSVSLVSYNIGYRHPVLDQRTREYNDQVSDLSRRIIEQRARDKIQDLAFFQLWRNLMPQPGPSDGSDWHLEHLAETLAARERLIQSVKWYDVPWFRWNDFTHFNLGIRKFDDPRIAEQFRASLSRIEKMGIANIQQSINQGRKRFDEELKEYLKQAPAAPVAINPAREKIDVIRHELKLSIAGAGGRRTPLANAIDERFNTITLEKEGKYFHTLMPDVWFKIDDKCDFVKFGARLFVMREKDVLTPLQLAHYDPETNIEANDVTFASDGQYLWMATSWSEKQLLAAYDLQTGRSWKLDATGGLPPFQKPRYKRPALIDSLSPGKVAVAGDFGRTWVGTATLNPQLGIKLDVIFEASLNLPDSAKKEERFGLDVAFSPGGMRVVSGRAKPAGALEQRIVLLRQYGGCTVIDPISKKAEVVRDAGGEEIVYDREGEIYFAMPRGHLGPDQMDLAKLSIPSLKYEKIETKIPIGQFYEDQGVHFLAVTRGGRIQKRADPWYATTSFPRGAKSVREETKDDLRQARTFLTGHYGLVGAWNEKIYRLEWINK